MNKSDLLRAIATREDLPVEEVEKVFNSALDIIGLSLALKEDVSIRNFGKFEVREHRAVTRRNPRTGEAIEVPAKTSLGFKPSPHLKGRVNAPQAFSGHNVVSDTSIEV